MCSSPSTADGRIFPAQQEFRRSNLIANTNVSEALVCGQPGLETFDDDEGFIDACRRYLLDQQTAVDAGNRLYEINRPALGGAPAAPRGGGAAARRRRGRLADPTTQTMALTATVINLKKPR